MILFPTTICLYSPSQRWLLLCIIPFPVANLRPSNLSPPNRNLWDSQRCRGAMLLQGGAKLPPLFFKGSLWIKAYFQTQSLFTCFYPAVSADNSSGFNAYHIDRQIPFPVGCSACYCHSQRLRVIFPDSHHLLMAGDSMKGVLWWGKQNKHTQWAWRPPWQLRHFLLKQIFIRKYRRNTKALYKCLPHLSGWLA